MSCSYNNICYGFNNKCIICEDKYVIQFFFSCIFISIAVYFPVFDNSGIGTNANVFLFGFPTLRYLKIIINIAIIILLLYFWYNL